jgi:hypothetical protein
MPVCNWPKKSAVLSACNTACLAHYFYFVSTIIISRSFGVLFQNAPLKISQKWPIPTGLFWKWCGDWMEFKISHKYLYFLRTMFCEQTVLIADWNDQVQILKITLYN